MSFIQCNNINYTYPLNSEANLKNLNFTVESGEFIGIIGENGAGKTSLCHVLRGFIPHFFNGDLNGEIIIDDILVNNVENYKNLAKKVGYVFQNPFTQLSGIEETVYDEIAFGLENIGVPSNEIDEIINNTLERLNLMDLKYKNPFELSGGQQQRLAFASVLAMNPDIYIIDEPSSQLDPVSTDEIFSILNLLKEEGKTIFLVEHKIDLLYKYATRIFVMDKGEIIFDDSPESIFLNEDILELNIDIPKNYLLGRNLKEWLKLDYTPDNLDDLRALLLKEMRG